VDFPGDSRGPVYMADGSPAARERGQYRRGVFAQSTTLWSSLEGRTLAGRAGDIKQAAWWKLMAAHARLVQWVGRDLEAATGLPLVSYNVLRLLQEAPGCRIRLGELAGAVFLTRGGATRLAKRLERAGLLRREGHARDRRGSCAVLTDRGRAEWRRASAVFSRTVAEHFGSHLSDAEAETLNAVLGRIVTAEVGADGQ
jgi:DNA-binding MarR family transcriptional regulator